jgi:hypothetical protein
MNDWTKSAAAPVTPSPGGAGATYLGQEHFLPLAVRGFGDPWNSYLHGMAWFDGHLYCGTTRAAYCMIKARKIGRPRWEPWPIKCPDGDPYKSGLDLRGQIWRFNPVTGEWQMVYLPPMVTNNLGETLPREVGYRGLYVLQTARDAKPALYASPYQTIRSSLPPLILRSEDGLNFEPATRSDSGLQGNCFRTVKQLKGRLYTTVVGSGRGHSNASLHRVIFESEDPLSKQWRPVCEDGFGDPNNIVIFEMEVFNGHLYAGVANVVSGFQLWKTDCEGEPPYTWKRVIHLGAYRGKYNQGIAAMAVFDGALYITACVQDGGYDRINRIGPAASELIRVNADDSWNLVVGTPRLTPDGVVEPTSGFQPGFDDLSNGYFWRMGVHQGRLYVGTMNWAVSLPYIDRRRLPEVARRTLSDLDFDDFIDRHGGFDLWSTADGDHFDPVTVSGFGSPFNSGVRQIVSTPVGLAVGTVNPFGPEVAITRGGGSGYELNPRGGAEVWLGAVDLPDDLRHRRPCGVVDGQPTTLEGWRMAPVGTAVERRKVFVDSGLNDPNRFEFDTGALRRRAARVRQGSLIRDAVLEAQSLFDLKAFGEENIPVDGPVLLLGNNPVAPLVIGGLPVAAHTVYTLDAVARRRGRPAWTLALERYFELAEKFSYVAEFLDRLAFVPGRRGNGTRLLEMGEAVLGYPEDRPSRPPYGLQVFSTGYVRMALDAGAPIVPVVFLGTHESHILIEHKGRQILVNKGQRLPAKFRLTFLPPIDPRHHLGGSVDPQALAGFCAQIRQAMRVFIDEQRSERPLLRVVDQLQARDADLKRELAPELREALLADVKTARRLSGLSFDERR